jgi:hypothetical protein
MIMAPSLELPLWLPLSCVALSAALSAFLNRTSWPLFIVMSVVASGVGLSVGYMIWRPPLDKPAVALPLFVALAAIATVIVALPSAFLAPRLSVRNQRLRNAAWCGLIITTAVGPTFVALTPP